MCFSRSTTGIDMPYGIGLNQDLCGAHNTLLIKCWSMIYYTMLNHFWESELFPILPSEITVKKLKIYSNICQKFCQTYLKTISMQNFIFKSCQTGIFKL